MNQKSNLSSKLNKKIILSYLDQAAAESLAELRVLEVVRSTNDEVMASLQESREGLVVCVANEQTNGRGRNGNTWQSPSDSNVYMSIGGVFDLSLVSRINGLSLACGVSIARFLEKIGLEVGVKWPNDILVDERKLAGVLVESRIKAKRINVVIGVGLNVFMPDTVCSDIDQPWTDLNRALGNNESDKSNSSLERNQLLAHLISELLNCLRKYNESEFQSFEKDWKRYDVLTGREVVIKIDDKELNAKVLGINEQLALKVKVGKEVKVFYAGDIKLKLKNYVNN